MTEESLKSDNPNIPDFIEEQVEQQALRESLDKPGYKLIDRNEDGIISSSERSAASDLAEDMTAAGFKQAAKDIINMPSAKDVSERLSEELLEKIREAAAPINKGIQEMDGSKGYQTEVKSGQRTAGD